MQCEVCKRNLVLAVTARYDPQSGHVVPGVQEYVSGPLRADAAHAAHTRYPRCTLHYCVACGNYTMLAQNPERDAGLVDRNSPRHEAGVKGDV